MKKYFLFFLFFLFSFEASAEVYIKVDLRDQRMQVQFEDNSYDWKISSGRIGYLTPNGKYGVEWLSRDHKSKKYNMAPMPYAIFFNGGYAIHGTYETGNLGRPASHGCIRLSVENAKRLFSLVQSNGARIEIVGSAYGKKSSVRSDRVNSEDDSGYVRQYVAPSREVMEVIVIEQ